MMQALVKLEDVHVISMVCHHFIMIDKEEFKRIQNLGQNIYCTYCGIQSFFPKDKIPKPEEIDSLAKKVLNIFSGPKKEQQFFQDENSQ